MASTSDNVAQTAKAGERHNAAFVVGSVLGGVVGAAVALWKAPQTGEELRQKLASSDNGESRSRRVVSTVRTESGGDSGEVRSGGVVSPVRTGSSRVLDSARMGSDRLLNLVKAGSDRLSRPDSTESKASSSGSTPTAPFSNRVLSFVEKAAAPIVGVKLGQTANGSGPAAGGSSARITPIRTAETTTTTAAPPMREDGLHGQDHLTFGTYSGRSTAAPSTEAASTIPNDSETRQTETLASASVNQGEMSAAATPSPASPDIPEGVPGHVPTTEELVTPSTPFVPQPNTAHQSPGSSSVFPEPDTNGTKRT